VLNPGQVYSLYIPG